MEAIPLKFRFKGHRNYVQGPDIYNAVVAQIEKIYTHQTLQKIKLTFHTIVSKQCDMFLRKPEEQLTRPDKTVAEFIAHINNKQLQAWLVETEQTIEDRYEYDEKHITDKCVIDGKKITIMGDSGYSPIEVVVAMNKHLHLNLISVDGIKWLFTRLELSRLLQKTDASKLTIELKQNFGNNKLTKSAIYINDENIGNIYFSAVKQ